MSLNTPTNVEVAERLDVSAAAVSRFRTGSRVPKHATMMRIADVYTWPISEQADSRAAGQWAADFEAKLCQPASVPLSA